MNNFLIYLFVFLAHATLSHSGEHGDKYVFIDGTFDLAHYGHQQVIENAAAEGMKEFHLPREKIKVIVGVSGSERELTSYKRKPVYSIEEKMRQISGFKGVYRVINSPMVTTRAFVEKYKIDLVVAGGDYEDPVKAKAYYNDPIEMGIFRTFPRTEGISTTKIMQQVVDSVADTLEKKLNPNDPQYEADRQAIKRFQELKNQNF